MVGKFKYDERVNVPAENLIRGNVDKVKFKKGYSSIDVVRARSTAYVYTKILFRLFELIILDVIDGAIVYLNKSPGARIFVDFEVAAKEFIMGKGLDKRNKNIPLLDLKKSNYKVPKIVMDPGYARSKLCEVRVPYYLYALLVDSVNKGKKYSRASEKQLWRNANKKC